MKDGGEWVVYARALRNGQTYGGNGRETKFSEGDLDTALAHGVEALAAQGKRYAAKYGAR
jgi:hypothetical protein